jgi:hypothetical protein
MMSWWDFSELQIIVHGSLSQWFQLVTHGTLIEF